MGGCVGSWKKAQRDTEQTGTNTDGSEQKKGQTELATQRAIRWSSRRSWKTAQAEGLSFQLHEKLPCHYLCHWQVRESPVIDFLFVQMTIQLVLQALPSSGLCLNKIYLFLKVKVYLR